MQNPSHLEEPELPDDGRPILSETQKEILIQRTKDLIDIIVKNERGVIFFLDRSARPLAWALQAAWPKYAGDRPMPKIKFINIGREKGDLVGWGSGPQDYEFDSRAEFKKAREIFWSKFDWEKYVSRVRSDIANALSDVDELDAFANNEFIDFQAALIVDDFLVSGFTQGLAQDFLVEHFPGMSFNTHTFFSEEDTKAFHNSAWNGAYAPWTGEKAYTLMGDDHHPESLTSTPERDLEKRKKGLALKREIVSLF